MMRVEKLSVANSFVNNTCNKFEEEFIKVCIDVIDSDPHQDLKLNLSGLLAIFINHSIDNATDNHLYLMEQLKRSDLDKDIRYTFNVCVEQYERGLDILKSSLEALLKNDKDDLGLILSDAFDKIVACEDDFESTPEPPSWLAHYLPLRKLLALSMGTANLIQCKKVAACIP
ncbi:uncharacterized protein LOC111008804 [Momordica charantia]|uniref:Uncharacterized protein LOC111008804 n=1 Tax=Momordica charantia TaxID=3673 RepID=A0A6J1C7W5_MOMCH|nr:uncharacterized protein LOC111008804 [Momordica charantia]